MSAPLTPAQRTRTRTSPAPGSGSARSSTRSSPSLIVAASMAAESRLALAELRLVDPRRRLAQRERLAQPRDLGLERGDARLQRCRRGCGRGRGVLDPSGGRRGRRGARHDRRTRLRARRLVVAEQVRVADLLLTRPPLEARDEVAVDERAELDLDGVEAGE